MPALELFVKEPDRCIVPDGNLDLDPPVAGLSRVLIRELSCSLRVPPHPGAYKAVVDTGAPLTVFPRDLWHDRFGWQAGATSTNSPSLASRHFRGRYSATATRSGWRGCGCRWNSPAATRRATGCGSTRSCASSPTPAARRSSCLGLWGGALTGRRQAVEPLPGADDLHARLEF